MYKQFENWLIENQGLKASTAKDYARDRTKALEKHLMINLEEFTRNFFDRSDPSLSEEELTEELGLSVLGALNGIYKTRKPNIGADTFRIMKSAVVNYIQFFAEREAKSGHLPAKTEKLFPVGYNNIAGIVIERSDLEKIYASRLRTQDRAYASGFVFPNRFFAKKYLGTDHFDKNFVKPQIAGARYFINAAATDARLSDVHAIRLAPLENGAYQVSAVSKQGEMAVYARDAANACVPLVVGSVGDISLDHFVPIQTILQKHKEEGSIRNTELVSAALREELTRRSLKTMPSDAQRTDIFKTVFESGVFTPEVVEGLSEEFKLISGDVRLELMHKHHNSAKGNR